MSKSTARPAASDLQHIGALAVDADRTERALREAEQSGVSPYGDDGTRHLRLRRDLAREQLQSAIAELEV